MKRSIAAFPIAITTASVAWAGKTDLEIFQKLLSKSAPADSSKSKTTCICYDTNWEKRAGVVTQTRLNEDVYFNCLVPVFNSGGDSVGGHNCDSFQVIR